MENFIPISRELLFSSLWRSLADKEAKILIDLMARAPYQPSTYNLYGVDIELQKYELCFFVSSYAEMYDMNISAFRRLIDKLIDNKVVVRSKRKLPAEFRNYKQTHKRNYKSSLEKVQYLTSITFCGWVFGENMEMEQNDQKISDFEITNELTNERVNIEGSKKEKTNIYNAREKNFSSNQEGVKNWISVERIKKLDFPHAEEIMKSWIKYCSKRKELVMEELEKYCDLQICLQQTEMTLPVFDYRFRGVLKRAFDVKECKKEEDKPYLNYLN